MSALLRAGVETVLVANRTWRKARALADRVGGQAVRLSDLPSALAEVDLLLTSTGATVPVVERDDFAPIMEERDGRPLLIVDIAVPRDVDPTVPHAARRHPARHGRPAAVGADRHRAPGDRTGCGGGDRPRRDRPVPRGDVGPLGRSRSYRRCTGRPRWCVRPSWRASASGWKGWMRRNSAAVDALTKGILGKLLFEPTVKLKDLAGTPTGERLAEAMRQLYDLDDL